MSWLTVLVRDIVEPATLAILQWAWSFDSADAPPALTLPFRFYAYSSTSVLLWLYELLPHWLLLTFLLLGVYSSFLAVFFVCCYPLRFAISLPRTRDQAIPPALSVYACGSRKGGILALL